MLFKKGNILIHKIFLNLFFISDRKPIVKSTWELYTDIFRE